MSRGGYPHRVVAVGAFERPPQDEVLLKVNASSEKTGSSLAQLCHPCGRRVSQWSSLGRRKKAHGMSWWMAFHKTAHGNC